MLAPPQARPLGARRGGDPAGAVNVDSNASRAREVERKCERVRFLLDYGAHAPNDPSKTRFAQGPTFCLRDQTDTRTSLVGSSVPRAAVTRCGERVSLAPESRPTVSSIMAPLRILSTKPAARPN